MKRIELTEIDVEGFKSIRSLKGFRPRPINVFIGQNGAGKSNFIGFFKFLSNMLSGAGNLANYTAINGSASVFLFDGPEVTTQLTARVSLRTSAGLNEYVFRLAHAANDTFIFSEEKFRYKANHIKGTPNWYALGAGHKESALIHAEMTGKTQGTLRKLLQQLTTYQFHNTTFNSPIRNNTPSVANSWYLEEDGRNLASVLLDLKGYDGATYLKIIQVLKQIIPFFFDFVLVDQYGKTYLRWKEVDSGMTFSATQASDGMLRAMSLVTLLCLPPARLPAVMFLDEPELGLHPSAIKTICDLIHGVSEHCQVFIATQDADMLNEFEPEDIVVVSRNGRASVFNQLNSEDLKDWVGTYSLSDLWHRNIIGGRP